MDPTMTAKQFRAWRKRCQLSLTVAAEALGIARSMVAAYQAGEYPVPRPVELACWAIERGALGGVPLDERKPSR